MKNIIYLVVLKPSSHRTSEESLGVQYLAAVLEKSGFIVKIRDSWLDKLTTYEMIIDEIRSEKEKILFVGISSYMMNNKISCKMITDLSNDGLNVIAGGYGPSFESEIFLKSGAKLVIVGEGEKTIIEVAKLFQEDKKDYSKIKGIVYIGKEGEIIHTSKPEPVIDLNELPYPKRPYIGIVKSKHSTVNVLTSRGCKGACYFCSISAFLSLQNIPRWRGRSINNIIGELIELKKMGVSTIKFIDDSFIENERDAIWCKLFLNNIRKNKLDFKFRASIRADKVTDENIRYLKKAGFFSFSCGIENGSKTALKRMAKMASIEDNEKALKIFKKYNIYVQGGFILFDNKTTMRELEENYIFLKKHIWLVTKGIFSEMYAAVGTKFTKSANLEHCDSFFSNKMYMIENIEVRKVYDALKRWQLHHSKIYDMVIDPISAPKDIPIKGMKKYYKLMLRMKRIDITYMKKVINCVKKSEDEKKIFDEFVKTYKCEFEKIFLKVKKFYEKDELEYDADINSFLTIND